MNDLPEVRVDRWLWAVRICKTRQQATDMCKRQKVFINGSLAKPSRIVKPGQLVDVKFPGILRNFEVHKCIEKRVSAKLAAECKSEITPDDVIAQFTTARRGRAPSRPQGMGRPTKKDRRQLEDFLDCD